MEVILRDEVGAEVGRHVVLAREQGHQETRADYTPAKLSSEVRDSLPPKDARKSLGED